MAAATKINIQVLEDLADQAFEALKTAIEGDTFATPGKYIAPNLETQPKIEARYAKAQRLYE
jgi:hypothetical protein